MQSALIYNTIKLLIVNNSVNNKLRDLIFGYVIAVIMTAMPKELMGFIKSYDLTHLILLQLSGNLVYGLRVVRLTFLPNFKKM